MNASKVNWPYWLNQEYIDCAQATLLLHNVEPQKDRERNYRTAEKLSSADHARFQRLCRELHRTTGFNLAPHWMGGTVEKLTPRQFVDFMKSRPEGLPDDLVQAIREEGLDWLEPAPTDQESSQPLSSDKKLDQRLKSNLLVVMAALAEKAGIAWQEKVASIRIKEAVDEFGESISEDTIRKYLREIPGIIRNRTK